jgi:hypothetical protein
VWEKSLTARAPVIRQWAETTIRAQQSALENLRAGGVDAAAVIQPYEPGGSLIIEHAGEPSEAALANDSSLRADYNAYLSRASPIAAGRVGRIPLIGRPIARYGGVAMHDLAGRNIGYTPGRGFIAFDPSSDGNFPGIFGTLGFYGEAVTPLQGLRLLTQPTPAGSGTGSPK